ncbi:MAG TPA: DUF1501 domain-containing protein [Pirellulales bacterium]|nr:DUF1501 domain-containing protein [Pirellulales bacterium]
MPDYRLRDHQPRLVDRRGFLATVGGGFAGMALSTLLAEEQLPAAGGEAEVRSAGKLPHFTPKAKQVIQIFVSGAMSQIDTFDYKPELSKWAGKAFEPGGKVELFESIPGTVQPGYWPFERRGECGRWVSSLFPHLATCVDDMCFIHSMVSKSNVHGPALFMMNSGFVLPGFPSMGSWVTYGLGTDNRNLPAFVVLPDPRGFPMNGPVNWGAGFLPATYQGTALATRASAPPIDNLFPRADERLSADGERDTLRFLQTANAEHARQRPGDNELDARINSYELAARLQLSAPEVVDFSKESEAVHRLYGLDDPLTAPTARQCLLARRLVERGVRFVQVWSGALNAGFPRQNWDGHEDMVNNHGREARLFDKPVAALLKDLKANKLLDETLVICTSEFGRMCCSQGGKGRDHNPFAFTSWLAGGGIKRGVAYGESDEFAYKTVKDPVYCYELHATALYLLGIDHTRLTYHHNGIDRRLTDVHGHVLHEILS